MYMYIIFILDDLSDQLYGLQNRYGDYLFHVHPKEDFILVAKDPSKNQSKERLQLNAHNPIISMKNIGWNFLTNNKVISKGNDGNSLTFVSSQDYDREFHARSIKTRDDDDHSKDYSSTSSVSIYIYKHICI
jgi:hypothetical protein